MFAGPLVVTYNSLQLLPLLFVLVVPPPIKERPPDATLSVPLTTPEYVPDAVLL